MVQELRRTQSATVAKIDLAGDVVSDVDDSFRGVELQSLLAVIAETNALAHLDRTAVGLLQPHQKSQECALATAVIAHNTKLFVAREVVVEAIEDTFLSVALADIFGLENFGADTPRLNFQTHSTLRASGLQSVLQIVEGVDSGLRLCGTRLGLATNPLQLVAKTVLVALALSRRSVDTLLTLSKIVRIVATIVVEASILQFENIAAHAVEKIAVVSDHQQRTTRRGQILFEPLGHLGVEVVGGLVENEQIALAEQYARQRNTLQLTSRKRTYTLVEIVDTQTRKYLFYTLFAVPKLTHIHLDHRLLQALARGIGDGTLVGRNHTCVIAVGAQTRLQNCQRGIERGILFEVCHAQVASWCDRAAIGRVAPRNQVEQSRFACAISGDQRNAFALVDRKRYVIEHHQLAIALCEVFDLEVTDHSSAC